MHNAKIIRVDLEHAQIREENISKTYLYLGGRSLTAAIIADEVPPTCHPLSPRNKCILATGLFAGTPFPCSGRLSIGAKSPLTGGIKESNVGGTAAWKLSRLGIRAIVIEGASPRKNLILKITKENTELIPAPDCQMLGTYRLIKTLRERFGPHIGTAAIGPAGELMLGGAGIAVTDLTGTPCDYAGRGGLGAVWGAKGLKAIVLDDKGAKNELSYADRKEFLRISEEFTFKLKKSKAALKAFGTAIEVEMSNELGYLPTRNYRFGQFEGAGKLSGERMQENIQTRGGKTSKACMPGCPIRCSNVYADPEGRPLTASLEYETIVMMGANCGIDDLDAVARLDRLCDDYGLDTMEMGAAIGVAMEAEIISFGDSEGAIGLLEEIPRNTPLGRIIGNGAEITGKVFGVRRVPTVKGQAMAAYDPRGNKGIGVTYMSSPMGADHTAGCVMPGRTGFDKSKSYDILRPEGQEELSLDLQIMVAVFDTLGLCFFTGLEMATLHTFARLHHAKFGSGMTVEQLIQQGRNLLKTEHRFNLAAGINPVSNLPEFFENEELTPHRARFDVRRDRVARHIEKELEIAENGHNKERAS